MTFKQLKSWYKTSQELKALDEIAHITAIALGSSGSGKEVNKAISAIKEGLKKSNGI